MIKNNICTYDLIAFRDFQIDLCKTVVSGTYDSLALNGKHGLHLRHWAWTFAQKFRYFKCEVKAPYSFANKFVAFHIDTWL